MALQHQYIDANIIAYWLLDVTVFNSIDFMKMIEMSCLECLQPWSAASRCLYAKIRACCLEAVWIPHVRFVVGALKTLAVRKEQNTRRFAFVIRLPRMRGLQVCGLFLLM